MKTKSKFKMEIKEVAADGSFEGILSPYGVLDQGGDVVERGAYSKTLKDQGNTRPMLWQHKSDQPIGLLTLEDRPDGLWCSGQILLDIPTGQTAYAVIKAGIVKGLSIGYETVKKSVKDGARHLQEIKLYEGSIVTFPMNEMALITAVKAHGETKDDFNEELAEIQLYDAGYQMRSALCSALTSLFWSGLDSEEIVSASELICQQFTEAYMAYVPAYLDLLTEIYGDMKSYAAKQVEKKSGATISAANKELIKSALSQIKSGHESLSALVPEEAGSSTSEEKAAAVEEKPEPVTPAVDHSAAVTLVDRFRSLIPA